MPAISIIIPVYNVAPYLRECLDSIQEQTFKDFEAILIDDGSTDGSGQICDWYASKYKRFKVIHKNNGGVSSARNMGLDMAQGEYIGFIDPDDYISPNFYELLLNAIQSNDADISISSMKFIDQHGNPLQIPELLQAPTEKNFKDSEIVKAYINGEIAPSLLDKLYKKACFNGIYMPEGISLLEDGAIMPFVLSNAKMVVDESKAVYYYRRRPKSLTSSAVDVKRVTELNKAVDIMTEKLTKEFPEAKEDISTMNLLYKSIGVVMFFSSVKRDNITP